MLCPMVPWSCGDPRGWISRPFAQPFVLPERRRRSLVHEDKEFGEKDEACDIPNVWCVGLREKSHKLEHFTDQILVGIFLYTSRSSSLTLDLIEELDRFSISCFPPPRVSRLYPCLASIEARSKRII